MGETVYDRAAKLGRPLPVKMHDYRGCNYDLKTDGWYYYTIPGHGTDRIVRNTFAAKEMVRFLHELYQYDLLDDAIDRLEGELTPSQSQCLNNMHRRILEQDSLLAKYMDNYEYKEVGLKRGYGKHVFWNTTVGRKEDDGTMAAIICRDHRHMVVGPRGGLRSLVGPKSKRTGVGNILIWGKTD